MKPSRDTEQRAMLSGMNCADRSQYRTAKVPVLEHPAVKQRALGKRMRDNILAACQAGIEQALNEVEFSE